MPFNRRVQVDIVRKGSLIALRVEGLRVVFDVKKDAQATSNTAHIQIYNLAPDTRAAYLQELGVEVILRAGYSDESLDEVFRGDVVSVGHPKSEADVVTTIEANDGGKAIRSSYSHRSYGEGTSVKQVLLDLVKDFGLTLKSKDWESKIEDQKFLQGFATAGPTRAALDKVLARLGGEWSVQGQQLQILKRGSVVPQPPEQIPLVSPEHGLVGSPERLQRVQGESPEKKPPGWRVKSLLLGRLEPGGQIGVQCADIPRAQAFRIQAVQHQGDTHGDNFFSLTEALDPGILLSTVRLDLEPARAVA